MNFHIFLFNVYDFRNYGNKSIMIKFANLLPGGAYSEILNSNLNSRVLGGVLRPSDKDRPILNLGYQLLNEGIIANFYRKYIIHVSEVFWGTFCYLVVDIII